MIKSAVKQSQVNANEKKIDKKNQQKSNTFKYLSLEVIKRRSILFCKHDENEKKTCFFFNNEYSFTSMNRNGNYFISLGTVFNAKIIQCSTLITNMQVTKYALTKGFSGPKFGVIHIFLVA